jgi:inositol 1,4,5-triphosphate receptor type 3
MDLMEIDNPLFGWKLVFDLSYFMIINIVSMNIIFGIIIDTFAELRDAQNTRDEDYKNVCFICGHERDTFEKKGMSFDKHVNGLHNPTNYINFLIHLVSKPQDEHDGVETYVYDQYHRRKTNWAPIENTMLISKNIFFIMLNLIRRG